MNKQPHLYMQTDSRWAKHPYRVPGEEATIGGSGCGPTCAAMLITTLTGKHVTPVDTCAWSVAHGYKALKQGTYYGYFPPQFKAHGIICTRLNNASVYGKPKERVHDTVLELLQAGYYIIACMGKGVWTSSGHFVVVWWADGKMYINDPASTKTKRVRGDVATFRRQVKYYWAIDAREYNKEDDEDMTQEQFDKMMEDYLARQRDKQPVQLWMREGIEKAKAAGVSDGSAPLALCTRAEAMIMAAAAKK